MALPGFTAEASLHKTHRSAGASFHRNGAVWHRRLCRAISSNAAPQAIRTVVSGFMQAARSDIGNAVAFLERSPKERDRAYPLIKHQAYACVYDCEVVHTRGRRAIVNLPRSREPAERAAARPHRAGVPNANYEGHRCTAGEYPRPARYDQVPGRSRGSIPHTGEPGRPLPRNPAEWLILHVR
jgi:hypothetical protein